MKKKKERGGPESPSATVAPATTKTSAAGSDKKKQQQKKQKNHTVTVNLRPLQPLVCQQVAQGRKISELHPIRHAGDGRGNRASQDGEKTAN